MLRRIEARLINPIPSLAMSLPCYATEGSAAMDLRACIDAPLVLQARATALVRTGLAINMQDSNLVAIVASRSGLSLKHGVRVAQGIGVIDADYHGEIAVILTNDSTEAYTIQPAERIAQLMFQPVVQVQLALVDAFASQTERGTGGFGSTGKA
jgi:dUTP pyrophosphatase